MTTRSSSPFDESALLEAETRAERLREKKRLNDERLQQRLNQSGSRQLVPESPSPRKKRQLERERNPTYFDSTQRPPPPSIANLFKPETSLSFARKEVRESQFSSHESAIPKSFVETLRAAKETKKQDDLRRQRIANRSTGFGTTTKEPSSSTVASTSTSSMKVIKEVKDGLMNARRGNDMKVRARSNGDSSSSKMEDRKGKGKRMGDDFDEEELRDVKPMISAMTRPKAEVVNKEEKKPIIVRKSREDDDDHDSTGEGDDDDIDIVGAPKNPTRRNKDSTVIEELEMGPIEFVPPKNDPDFRRIEPNSGIHLKERIIPHDRVQQLLSDRYHLTPSQIYSLARIDTRKQVHIDVDSDFVIIGVLAWKDEIRFLNSNPLAEPRKPSVAEEQRQKRTQKQRDPLNEDLPEDAKPDLDLFKGPTKKQKRQRYIRFELVDLSTTQSSGSGTGTLNVMLIEADTVDTGFDEDGNEIPIYRGQSGGAYEKYWKESPGAVVAIINPHFLPYTQGRSHTLKPISADSMVVLGRARHLTFCDALKKKDGQKCNAWVDSRVSTKCQYHIQLAISRAGVGRAETFSNTASFKQTTSIDLSKLNKSLSKSTQSSSSSLTSTSSTSKSRLNDNTPSNVVIGGHTTYVSGASRTTGGTRTSSNALNALTQGGIGLPTSRGSGGFIAGVRDGPVVSEEKKKREREKLDKTRARRELRELGKSDGGKSLGGEYLKLAREMDKEKKKRERDREAKEREKEEKKNGKGKGKKQKRETKDSKSKAKRADDSSDEDRSDDDDDDERDDEKEEKRRKVFSSEAVRLIGYNPTLRAGEVKAEKEDEETLQQRLALEGGLRHTIKLTAPPGQKVVSGVDIDPATVAASKAKQKKIASSKSNPSQTKPPPPDVVPTAQARVDVDDDFEDDDDDDLLIEGAPTERPKIALPRSRPVSRTPDPTIEG